ncbi:PD-(D/E)XK nuclease family protein [Virgibacillus sp. DJP39]|uniref:PD-(D/E)XK nuclease family protein n=1 Tax=Virgibacillus sp. DJP39 TaxID=3409790 RepID=UPI003BB7766E
MDVILGYWLDSTTYPDALGHKEASVGTVVTGFKGLFGILETQLGLTSPEVSENLRIASWQELLGSHASEEKPYAKSYQTDSWNTAKELLRRRDELVLAGWDPEKHVGGSDWIQTLADLELANKNKLRGFPDRLQALLQALKQAKRNLDIDQIIIVEEDEKLWDVWAIQLLDMLKNLNVQVIKHTPQTENDNSDPLSDLSLLQSVLAGDSEPKEASGDESLLLVQAEQEWDAADFLISWLQEKGSDHTILIKGEGSLFLDELLHRRGVPAIGTSVPSKWRAILQVLPLTIETYWQPQRVDQLLELLTIPSSPVPGKIRFKLAKVLSNAPGLGGPEWEMAIEEGIKAYEELWLEEGLNESDLKKKRKNLEDKLALWIQHDYFDPYVGMPVEKLSHICQKLGQWAMVRFQLTRDTTYEQVMKHATEILTGVKTLGVENITRLQVVRVIESVIGEGAPLPNNEQEASKWEIVKQPGDIWDHGETILWWGFHKNMSGPNIRTWSTKERTWLEDQGVLLIGEDVKRRREAASWQRAARLANRRLILIAPTKVKGEERTIHPFWDEIRFAVAREDTTVDKLTLNAGELRKALQGNLEEKTVERVPLESRALPQPIRSWRLPRDVVQPQKVESATSMESLVGCPVQWTFKYASKIRQGSILSLPNESIMLGNLGHKILETLIEEKTNWDTDEVKYRGGELFDEWVPKLAAPLLKPEKTRLLNQTRFDLQESLKKFFLVLNEAGINIHHTEHELQKPWDHNVEFKGILDLVGETPSGKKMLIDAKWSKRTQNYKKRIENLSVQLTLYHWLLSDNSSDELPVAYFMLSSGEFFGRPHEEVPKKHHVESSPSLIESYQTVKESVQEVWTHLAEGTAIATGVAAENPDDDKIFTPIIDPPCIFCDYKNLCGVRRVKK